MKLRLFLLLALFWAFSSCADDNITYDKPPKVFWPPVGYGFAWEKYMNNTNDYTRLYVSPDSISLRERNSGQVSESTVIISDVDFDQIENIFLRIFNNNRDKDHNYCGVRSNIYSETLDYEHGDVIEWFRIEECKDDDLSSLRNLVMEMRDKYFGAK